MMHHGPSPLPGPFSRAWPTPPSNADREDRPIRTELVARVRAEIAAGTYDTPEKFDMALDRLLARLESED